MKNTKLLLIALLVSCASFSFGQIQVYLGTGYFQGATQTSNYQMTNVTSTGVTTLTGMNYSGGGGIPVTLGLSLGVTDNVAVDLGIDYWIGSKITTSDIQSPFGNELRTSSNSGEIRVTPSVVVKSGGSSGIYGRFGAVIPVAGKGITEVEATDAGGTVTMARAETSGNLSVGFVGGLGIELGLNDNLQFFGEVQGISLTSSPSQTVFTEYSVGGTDQLGALPTFAKEINYVEELTASSNSTDAGGTVDPTKGEDQIGTRSTSSSLGLRVGVKMAINK